MAFQIGHKVFPGTEKTFFKKGSVPWNKGKAFDAIKKEKNPRWKGGLPKCSFCKKELTAYTSTYCNKCKGQIISKKQKGRNIGIRRSPSTEFKKGITPWSKGRNLPSISGNNHHNWKGGITPENRKIRDSPEYKAWRKRVFERDYYTCQECAAKNRKGLGTSVKINAHHIKAFSEFPKLRLDVNNGETLCESCHRKTFGRRTKCVAVL